jgi:hypothetical protein
MNKHERVLKLVNPDPIERYALRLGVYSSTDEMVGNCLEFIDGYVLDGLDHEITPSEVVDAWHGYLIDQIVYKKMSSWFE